jgi:hypothetical protein
MRISGNTSGFQDRPVPEKIMRDNGPSVDIHGKPVWGVMRL